MTIALNLQKYADTLCTKGLTERQKFFNLLQTGDDYRELLEMTAEEFAKFSLNHSISDDDDLLGEQLELDNMAIVHDIFTADAETSEYIYCYSYLPDLDVILKERYHI